MAIQSTRSGFNDHRCYPAWFAAVGLIGIVQLGMTSILMPLSRSDPTQSGFVFGMFALAGITAPWLGRIADQREAHRLAFIAGAAFAALGLAVVALFDAYFPMVLLGSGMAGIGTTLASTVMFSFIVLDFAKPDRSAEMGRLEIVYYGGQMAGLALVGMGLSDHPPLGFGIAAILLGIAAVLGTWLLPARHGKAERSPQQVTPQRAGGAPVPGPPSAPHPAPAQAPSLLREFGWFFAGWFLLYGGGSTFSAAFPALVVKDFGEKAWMASVVYAIGIGASLFIFPFATRRSNETSPGATLVAGSAIRGGLLLGIAAFTLLGQATSFYALAIGFIAIQAIWPLVSIGSNLLLTRHEPKRSSAVIGWLNAVSATAGGIGAVLAGMMVPHGTALPAVVCASFIVLGTGFLIIHARRSKRPTAHA